jgi:hypothetical protein
VDRLAKQPPRQAMRGAWTPETVAVVKLLFHDAKTTPP